MVPAAPEAHSLAYTQAAETVVAQLTPLPPTQTAMYTPQPPTLVIATQLPSATPAPSATYTLAPIGALSMLQVTVYSYCREGPGDQYAVDAIIFPGDAFTPQGKTQDGGWWYVAAPKLHRKRPADHCWISNSVVSSSGSTAPIPVVPTPTLATPLPGG